MALNVEIRGEHLVFLNSEGKLAALFLIQTVESWREIASEPIATVPLARSDRWEFLDP